LSILLVVPRCTKALDRDPQHQFARELLGSALWKNGDAVHARDLLSKAAAQPELGNEEFRRLALPHKRETSIRPSSFFSA
jgi:hypothetical protein